jgi:hypothetical protein
LDDFSKGYHRLQVLYASQSSLDDLQIYEKFMMKLMIYLEPNELMSFVFEEKRVDFQMVWDIL